MAGQYTSQQAIQTGVRFRANANSLNTSDSYLDSALLSTAPTGYTLAAYPKAYYDSVPEFTITPFLSQYVFTFNDKIPSGTSVKYQGTAVKTTVSSSVLEGYRKSETMAEQIIYIPGSDYLSSMGDLSSKYPSQLTITNGKRLLDVTVGSDVPNYFNSLLKAGGQFNINDGAKASDGSNNPNKKTLLEKIVLTNLPNLSDAIDVSGSEKLIEFRALGTQIPNVTFAEGAPLSIVHLPSTATRIYLTEAKNITRILETKPVVCTLNDSGVATYADASTYKGLYIEGLTDSDSTTQKTLITQISIVGGGLGYDSYKLMKKAVDIKKVEFKTDSTLSIGMNFEKVE